MRITLRALSALLRYPDVTVVEVAPMLEPLLLEDGLLSSAQRAALAPLIGALADGELLDLQEAYVALFDRGRAFSLHLFEHVHGESCDRGQAMVDLRSRYQALGLEITANELPDYLPLFLEYLSCLPSDRVLEELAQPGVILAALADRLEAKGTAYAAPLRILADLAGAGGEAFEIAAPDDPDDLAALDAAWAEEQVRFDTPTSAGAAAQCPQAAAMVARFQSPQPVRSANHG